MKVFLVESGSVPDFYVFGIYSTKELAIEACHLADGNENSYPHIKEIEVDKFPEWYKNKTRPFQLNMEEHGDVDECIGIMLEYDYEDSLIPKIGTHYFFRRTDGQLICCFYIFATNKEHAEQIAMEKRESLIMSGKWEIGFDKARKQFGIHEGD